MADGATGSSACVSTAATLQNQLTSYENKSNEIEIEIELHELGATPVQDCMILRPANVGLPAAVKTTKKWAANNMAASAAGKLKKTTQKLN